MGGAAAAALTLAAGAAQASTDDRALLAAWAKARAAATAGASIEAAQSYAAALALTPDNELLAARALTQAVAAGDMGLAVRAARILERKGQVAPDARLLLLSEALRNKDWKAANTYIDEVQKDEIFAFMAPVLRAWVAQGSGKGDPIAILDAGANDQLAAGYAAEHRPLLLIADGKRKEGLQALNAVIDADRSRATRLRLSAAASLARKDRKAAYALLDASGEPGAAARRLLDSGKAIPAAIDTPREGAAAFFIRVALDLQAQEVGALALTYARLATYLAPESSETWIVASTMLDTQGRKDDAIALLANVQPGDPFYGIVPDRRIRLLADAGKADVALAEAKTLADAPGATMADAARYGDILSGEERHAEAAAAYERAIELAKAGKPNQQEWTLWLLLGGALEQADRWPEAKAALETAYKLAPDQPLVLNYLGYGQLERRENVEEAMKLVAEASRLDPNSPEITDSLGWAHFLRGDVATAIPLLEKAALARPSDVEINEHLGDAYYSAGRRFEARYAWEAALLNAEGKHAERLRAKIGIGLTAQLASP